ncbi:alanyl-tRNA editing protein AlaX [archaeon CG10_big_fil_rev_8_21_14_0_10_43_11]|nr:MAG: alanyl-tRNA editing protein AlaX [archaeon CG10_big_fil_rev_8_21_14_0_10_43_11]
MTDALYLDDSYLRIWTARVVSLKDDTYVVLDKTAFYPTGGGQPSDTGVIRKEGQAFRVVFVGKFNGTISHEVDAPGLAVGDIVSCEIDWQRRYALMRAHTASHVLSAVLLKTAHAKITGNQLGLDKSRMDFSMDDYSPEKLQQFVNAANSLLAKCIPITISYITREQARAKPELARLAKGLLGKITTLRVVTIGEVDEQADGGTHVKNTQEVGAIRLLKTDNKGKNNRRLYFELV